MKPCQYRESLPDHTVCHLANTIRAGATKDDMCLGCIEKNKDNFPPKSPFDVPTTYVQKQPAPQPPEPIVGEQPQFNLPCQFLLTALSQGLEAAGGFCPDCGYWKEDLEQGRPCKFKAQD